MTFALPKFYLSSKSLNLERYLGTELLLQHKLLIYGSSDNVLECLLCLFITIAHRQLLEPPSNIREHDLQEESAQSQMISYH